MIEEEEKIASAKTDAFLDKFGPDPDLYAKMSEPYDTRDEATEAIHLFLLGVKELREKCGIAEVIVLAGAHHVPSEIKDPNAPVGSSRTRIETVAVNALTLGNSDFAADLAALAYNLYTMPVINRAKKLRSLAHNNQEEDL